MENGPLAPVPGPRIPGDILLHMNLEQLSTPFAVVDVDVLTRNATRMAEKAHRLGVRLRPHVKTHKCVEAARIQTAEHFGGITVSTLAEARFFADGGFRDIIYAVPISPPKLEEVVALAGRVERFAVLLDDAALVPSIEEIGRREGKPLEVYLKVDVGGGRAGVDPGDAAAENLAASLHDSQRITFRGILTHAGQSYDCADAEAVRQVAATERDVMVAFANRLRKAGVEVAEISIGSTPTAHAFDDLTGIDEIRPGNYAFHDAFQNAVGSCSLEDVAFFVVATVIGIYPERGRAVIDAGALALSKDRGPVHVQPDCGYGQIVVDDPRRPRRGVRLSSLSQEHGVVTAVAPDALKTFELGERVWIAPNHSCLAAACFDSYNILKGKDLVNEWRPARGW